MQEQSSTNVNVLDLVIRELKTEIKDLKLEIKELREIHSKYSVLEAQLAILFDRLELIENKLSNQTIRNESMLFDIIKLLVPFILGLISALIVTHFK